jgi:hypothetical protein
MQECRTFITTLLWPHMHGAFNESFYSLKKKSPPSSTSSTGRYLDAMGRQCGGYEGDMVGGGSGGRWAVDTHRPATSDPISLSPVPNPYSPP